MEGGRWVGKTDRDSKKEMGTRKTVGTIPVEKYPYPSLLLS